MPVSFTLNSGYFFAVDLLAVTPASMMLGVIQSNRENVLEAIRRFRLSLDEIETALQTEDFDALESILKHSRLSYETIVSQTH